MKNRTTIQARAAVAMLLLALIASACGSSRPDVEAATADERVESEAVASGPSSAPSVTEIVAFHHDELTIAVAAAQAPDPVSAPTIEFESCGEGAECGVIVVPIEHDSPDGDTTEVHVTRHPARGERIGTLFVNPGGPGLSTEQFVKGIANFGPPPLAERFDIVGIDPRGTGKSVPITCNDNWEDDLSLRPTPEDGFDDDVALFLEDFDEMAAVCEQRYGAAYLASITTENAARDMEAVRLALGDEPISYLGKSYGTAIGAIYATMFPDSIRSVILDGAVPTDPESNLLLEEGRARDDALVRLDRSCELWTECPLGEHGLLAAIDTVRDTLHENGAIGPLTLASFERTVGLILGVRPAMPHVAQGLALAMAGDGTMLHAIGSDTLTPLPDDGFAEFSGRGQAIICADGWALASTTADRIQDQIEQTHAAFPNLGPGFRVPCDRWPVVGNGLPTVDYRGDAPILVVGNTHDAITPFAWTEQLTEDLRENATLLRWDGADHTVVFNGATRCIDDAALAFLIDGVLPADGASCVVRGLMGFGYDPFGPVVITRVTPGSAADLAGIEVGDTVLTENGQAIESPADFMVGGVGEQVVLEVRRGQELLTFEMTRGTPIWDLWMTDDPAEQD